MIFRSLVVWFLLCATALADAPWDSICEVYVKPRAWSRKSIGGSGTLVYKTADGTGYILTVKHVAKDVGKRAVCRFNGVSVNGETYSIHTKADLAIIRVERVQDIAIVPTGRATSESGPFVLAGYPGYDRPHLHWQQGDFLAFSDEAGRFKYDAMYVDCIPEGGMSGGPCFDKYGKVVGAVSASMWNSNDKNNKWGSCADGDSLQEILGTIPR